jgi:hypothetical protein
MFLSVWEFDSFERVRKTWSTESDWTYVCKGMHCSLETSCWRGERTWGAIRSEDKWRDVVHTSRDSLWREFEAAQSSCPVQNLWAIKRFIKNWIRVLTEAFGQKRRSWWRGTGGKARDWTRRWSCRVRLSTVNAREALWKDLSMSMTQEARILEEIHEISATKW